MQYYSQNPKEYQINPPYLASIYERGAGDMTLVCAKTKEVLSKKYCIVYADARAGYFIEDTLPKIRENKGKFSNKRYKIHHNFNLKIIKND